MATGINSAQSSSDELEDDSRNTQSEWLHTHDEDESLIYQSIEGTSRSGDEPRGQSPVQKRRRVTRACDECRRKKIKCDGKQPCTHCTVYSYDCTYDQPSNRRRNPAPQYTEALEARLQRAEVLLKKLVPNFDLEILNGKAASVTDLQRSTQARIEQIPERSIPENPPPPQGSTGQQGPGDAELESMVQATGQLDLDDQGFWDFYGPSSGLAFLRRMRDQFGDIIGLPDMTTPNYLKRSRPLSVSYDSPRSVDSPLDPHSIHFAELPPRETAMKFVSNALDCAGALIRFVHQPTFYERFNNLYDKTLDTYGDEEHKFLPLLYIVLALGCLFNDSKDRELVNKWGLESATDEGFKYYQACRSLIDVADCRDITSLQTILFMIMFLQASARLSTCYSYIGIACHSALRMGLHRRIRGNFNPIELETRKRIFWVVRKMDIYVSAMLGLPITLSDNDIDQLFPTEVDDEYITKDGILPMPNGRVSLYAASNAHMRLVNILSKVIKHVYPTKGPTGKSSGSYVVSHAKIREIERDLQQWMEQLPMELRPSASPPAVIERVQQLLRMAYAHVQMILYRPFLHYASQSCASKGVDKRSYACAAACVSVSRNIVHITAEMKRRGLLVGAYWFTTYTTFFAILALVFYVLENPDNPGSQDILKDANDGKDTLASLAKRSVAAKRCMQSLGTIFDRLPERLMSARSKALKPKKKRQAQSPAPDLVKGQLNGPELIKLNEPVNQAQRAGAFPMRLQTVQTRHPSMPFDSPNGHSGIVGEPGFRRSLHELDLTTDASSIGTPESTGSMPLSQQFVFQQPFGENGLPDMNNMMFPTGDPFAYPEQPMTTFENEQCSRGSMDGFVDPDQKSGLFIPNDIGGAPYDSLEAQLFGPLPPYLMSGQHPSLGNSEQMETVGSTGLNMKPNPQLLYGQPPRGVGTTGMNLNDIFGSDDWNNMLLDQLPQS